MGNRFSTIEKKTEEREVGISENKPANRDSQTSFGT